jgi:membrane protein implicated in regulation of membrane protease activity
LLTALVAWLTPISLAWQLGLFIAASLLSLLSLRNVIQKRLFTESPADEEDQDNVLAVAGERGVVTETIAPPAEGRIKYAGSFWRAAAEEMIEEGEIISVVQQKGLVIHVEKV